MDSRSLLIMNNAATTETTKKSNTMNKTHLFANAYTSGLIVKHCGQQPNRDIVDSVVRISVALEIYSESDICKNCICAVNRKRQAKGMRPLSFKN